MASAMGSNWQGSMQCMASALPALLGWQVEFPSFPSMAQLGMQAGQSSPGYELSVALPLAPWHL